MAKRDVLQDRFFTSLISGHRTATRQLVHDLLGDGQPAEKILTHLFWPTLEHIQKLHRADQLTTLAHHYATRLLRSLINQMHPLLEQAPRREKTVLLISGPDESEELASQIAADLIEADGYDLYFPGGGVANDEVVSELGQMNADILIVFGAVSSTVPTTRQLIDRLHSIGACPKLQIVVGGGVFNRADGLAEEIGADLWAKDPKELVSLLAKSPKRRMTSDQRTVGRKRRVKRSAA
jgi:methanogenic corrinoid protein MtbC1